MHCYCFLLHRYFLTFPFFFFNDTATTEIYTLSLHDALPICFFHQAGLEILRGVGFKGAGDVKAHDGHPESRCDQQDQRSEEHTSELQPLAYLVCRLLLEKKKRTSNRNRSSWSYSPRRASTRH